MTKYLILTVVRFFLQCTFLVCAGAFWAYANSNPHAPVWSVCLSPLMLWAWYEITNSKVNP